MSETPETIYAEAINHWAFAIRTDNGLQGMCMGRVFAYGEVIGRNANEIVGDLREAQMALDAEDEWCQHGIERDACVFCMNEGKDVRDGFCPNEEPSSTWHIVHDDGTARCCRCGHEHPYRPGLLEGGKAEAHA